jgi:tripartite-type tricarboxylate transporter receptor subunit TctC
MRRDIVGKLNAEIARIEDLADFKQTLATLGAEPVTATPDEFAAHMRSEIEKLGAIVRAVGARVD